MKMKILVTSGAGVVDSNFLKRIESIQQVARL